MSWLGPMYKPEYGKEQPNTTLGTCDDSYNKKRQFELPLFIIACIIWENFYDYHREAGCTAQRDAAALAGDIVP